MKAMLRLGLSMVLFALVAGSPLGATGSHSSSTETKAVSSAETALPQGLGNSPVWLAGRPGCGNCVVWCDGETYEVLGISAGECCDLGSTCNGAGWYPTNRCAPGTIGIAC